MANAEHINQVIASIKGEIGNTGFNMGDFITDDEPDLSGRSCGTVACIAGHAYILATKNEPRSGFLKSYEVETEAIVFLGLEDVDSDDLFYGHGSTAPLSKITPEQAIRTLEHLRDTGEVSWEV